MLDRNPIEQLQRRLVELGCPAKALRRIVRETSEHYEDLQRAAHAQGLVGEQVTAFAAEKLGNPVELANRHVEALRKSSWWGRYPQFAFGILPLLVAFELGLQYFYLNRDKLPMGIEYRVNEPIRYPEMVAWAYPAFFVAIIAVTAAVTFFFAYQAQRSGIATRWMWITGGVLAMHGLFLQVHPTSGIFLHLIQPLAVTDQKVAPGSPMRIEISSTWNNSGQLTLYHNLVNGEPDGYLNIWTVMPRSEAMTKQKYLEPFQAPDLEAKINLGVAELRQRSLRGQLPPHSLHDPGWTASVTYTYWQTAWSDDTGTPLTALDVLRDKTGNLNWALHTYHLVPWPVLSYGLPGWGYGDAFQAINIACPLLIVAAMLAWQRRRGKRLLRESNLSDGQLIGVA